MSIEKLGARIEAASRLRQDAAAWAAVEDIVGPAGAALLDPASRSAAPLRGLLAGLCARADRLEDAWRLLSVGVTAMPLEKAKALIVDPSLTRVRGHYHNAVLFYRRALEEAGFPVKVARPAVAGATFAGDMTGSLPVLTISRSLRLFARQVPRFTAAANRLFALDFRTSLPQRRPRITVVPTALDEFFLGFAVYLAEAEPNGPARLLIANVNNALASTDCPEPIRQVYRDGFARLAEAGVTVAIVAETAAIAGALAPLLAGGEQVIVSPYVGGQMVGLAAAAAVGTEGIVAGFVGSTRGLRGAGLMPAVIRRTLVERGDLRWQVQLDLERLAKLTPDRIDDLIAEGRVRLSPQELSSPDYYGVLRSIDVMVLPYTDHYMHAASGVGAECLLAGSVQVVPAESTMATVAAEYGAGFTTFDRHDADSVAAAVMEAVDRFPELSERSKAAALRYAEDPSVAAIRAFIAEARRG